MKATTISSCLLAAMTLISSRNVRADIVTLNDNGGYGGSGFVEVAYGEDMPWISMPWYDNYRFDGYYDQAGKMYYDQWGSSVTTWDKDGDAMLYAKWIKRADLYADHSAAGGKEDRPQRDKRDRYPRKGYLPRFHRFLSGDVHHRQADRKLPDKLYSLYGRGCVLFYL